MSVEPVRHLITVDEYEGMGEAGLFDPDVRYELIEGEIFEMSPIGPRHSGTVNRLNMLLTGLVRDRAIVSVQNPVVLSRISEPQPDILVLRPDPGFYTGRHPQPADVLFAIEVSDSSAAWDRNRKRPLYAAAGVAEMWIVDVGLGVIEVATVLGPSGYGEVRTARPGETIQPTAFPDLAIAVSDILG